MSKPQEERRRDPLRRALVDLLVIVLRRIGVPELIIDLVKMVTRKDMSGDHHPHGGYSS